MSYRVNVFRRRAILVKIALVALIVFMVLIGVGGLVGGIVVGAILKSFLFFLIIFGSAAITVVILFLARLLIVWVEKDYQELDEDLSLMNAKISRLQGMLKQHESSEHKEILKETPKQTSTPVKKEEIKTVESVNSNKPKIISEIKETPKAPVKEVKTPPEKGLTFVFLEDYSDYGFEFKKGMKCIVDDVFEEHYSIRMIDKKIKGMFRIPKKHLGPAPVEKKMY